MLPLALRFGRFSSTTVRAAVATEKLGPIKAQGDTSFTASNGRAMRRVTNAGPIAISTFERRSGLGPTYAITVKETHGESLSEIERVVTRRENGVTKVIKAESTLILVGRQQAPQPFVPKSTFWKSTLY